MKTRKIALGLLAVLVVAGAAGWLSLDKETRGLLATLPTNRDVLFWSQPQRDAGFRALDRLTVLAKSRDDKVSDYIAQMKGSAYDDVSIRQLLTMTSGVRWNEDYADPNSDVAQFNKHKPEDGVDALVSYMRRLPREVPAGTRWHYSTGETNLVGVLLGEATKKPLATYLSEKIWAPAGMEQQATWILNRTGKEISGCCIQAATRDVARFGVFILGGARVNGQSIVPEGWLAEATTQRTGIDRPGRGYGYQWWTYTDGTFAARGIFGQGLFIDPKRKIVIASNANWAGGATDRVASPAREAFYRAVQKAIDDEAAGAASPPRQ